MTCPDCSPPRAAPCWRIASHTAAVAHRRSGAGRCRRAGEGALETEVAHDGGHHPVTGQAVAALEVARPGEEDVVAVEHVARSSRPGRGRRRRRGRDRRRAPGETTASASVCGAVAPQPALMLGPSGIRSDRARPGRRGGSSKASARPDAAPWAASTTSRRPARGGSASWVCDQEVQVAARPASGRAAAGRDRRVGRPWLHQGLELLLGGLGQLLAARPEDLDAVVGGGVVRGGDDAPAAYAPARRRWDTAGVGSTPAQVTRPPAAWKLPRASPPGPRSRPGCRPPGAARAACRRLRSSARADPSRPTVASSSGGSRADAADPVGAEKSSHGVIRRGWRGERAPERRHCRRGPAADRSGVSFPQRAGIVNRCCAAAAARAWGLAAAPVPGPPGPPPGGVRR